MEQFFLRVSIMLVPALMAITCHEVSHGYIAYRFGDNTAKSLGRLTLNPLESIQTMTAYIVQVSLGDTPSGSIAYQTIFAVGILLFAITLVMNWVANRVLKRFREVYE